MITDGISDFSRYFRPILSDLNSYHWLLVGRLVWNLPEQWFQKAIYEPATDRMRGPELDTFESEILEQEDNYLFAKPTFLEEYAEYLRDDWVDIIGFRNPSQSGLDLWKEYSRHRAELERNTFLNNEVDICFFNIDGVYWEIFAKEGRLLAEVVRHAASLEGFEVTELDLSDKTI